MKKVILLLFLLSTNLTFGQIINGGFEIWDTAYTAPYDSSLISLFGVPNPKAGIANHWVSSNPWGTNQTTDSYTGNYSMVLHNWYNYARGWITYHNTINYRPKYLQGFFKYITGGINGLSHGKADVTLTRFNGISNDTIATGSFLFDSTNSYTPFQINLNYRSASNPDSIKIYIINSNTNVFSNVVCHLLYLDNLSLTDSPLGIENSNPTENPFIIYPNPTVSELYIQNNSDQLYQFSFYNFLGEKIIDRTLSNKINVIDLSHYSSAIYFYTLSNNKLIKSGKIIKH